ncbi:hypothetical protein E3E26_10590 [Thermococcus sp. LS1]|uniref:transglutaminase domain-containing protein n=1 Tax=Thermococcus sp. LS1 TaxID=1638259 RepID=UPI001439EC4A|nr:transglutaminase domain-containing protein [Thermococcus sp. LS1]NJE00217.1 hypothetical protein [Thermococcus sp. LS1]
MHDRVITLTIKQAKKTTIVLLLIAFLLLFVHFSYVRSGIYIIGVSMLWLVLSIRALDILKQNSHQILEQSRIHLEIKLFRPLYLVLLLILVSPLFSPLASGYLLTDMEHRSREELYNTTLNLVPPNLTDYEKAEVIFEYVHATMKNTYFSDISIPLIGSVALYHSKHYGWFICMRIENYSVVDIIGSKKCGACREYAMLFMRMAEYANLTVRMVHNLGEDHSWDEVLINGTWIVVDPSAGIFNASPSIYEDKWGKALSYVYAIYPNGSKVDITSRYTKTATLNINVVDTNKNPLPNIKVYVLSHNYFKDGRFTGLICKTDYNGKCTIELGGGAYTLVAKSDGIIPLYAEKYVVLNENKTYHKTIMVSRNVLHMSYPTWIGTIIKGCVSILVWLSLIFLNEISKIKFAQN